MTLLERVRFRRHRVEVLSNRATHPSRQQLADMDLPPAWEDACAAITVHTAKLLIISFWGFGSLPIAIATFQFFGEFSMTRAPSQVLLWVFAQVCLSIAAEMALSRSYAQPVGTSLSICAYARILKIHWKGLIGLAGIRLMTTLALMLAVVAIAFSHGLAPSSSQTAEKDLAELRRVLTIGSIDGFVLGPQHLLSGFIDNMSRTLPRLLWGDIAPFSDALKWEIYQRVGGFITPGFAPDEKNTSARTLWLGLIVCFAAAGSMELAINIRINEMTSVLPVHITHRAKVALKGAVGFGVANITTSLLMTLGVSIPMMLSSQLVEETVAQTWGAAQYVHVIQWISTVIAVLIGAIVVMLRILYMNALWRRLAADCNSLPC